MQIWTRSIPNTVDTKFPIRSLTEQFPAAGILLLQEQGKLSVNEPVSKYLADLPDAEYGDHQKSSNTLFWDPDFTGAPGFSGYELQSHAPEESVALVRGKPLDLSRARSSTTGIRITFFWAKSSSMSPERRMPLYSARPSLCRPG